MMLRDHATAAQAVEALWHAVTMTPNAYNAPPGGTVRDSYMDKVDELEGQLGNVFERASVEDLLHTTRYWFIANNPATTTHLPMFRTVNLAVSKEIDKLVKQLEAEQADFKRLSAWLDLGPGPFVLLDCNVLMHCEPIDTIDWRTELASVGGAERSVPRLIVPLAVVKELDRKKVEGTSDRIRGRAQKATKSLRNLRSGVGVDEPAIVKAAHGSELTLEIPRDDIGRSPLTDGDAELIAFGQFLARADHRPVAIVTRDLNLATLAERADLKVAWLDDKYTKDEKAPVDGDR